MKRFRHTAALGLAVILTLSVCPPASSLPFEGTAFHHLTSSSSALSNNSIRAIVQDSNGFIWIGTEDGLNRYDGVSFRTYHKQDLSLKTSFIVSLCADTEGNVWVGTDSGMTRYDYATDSFIPFEAVTRDGVSPRGKVSCIMRDSSSVIWFSAGGDGLFRYDPGTGELSQHFHGKNGEEALPAGVTAFCMDGDGDLWLSLYFAGLYHVDAGLKGFSEVKCDKDISGDYIVGVHRDASTGLVHFASTSLGLCELDPGTGHVRVLIAGGNPWNMFVDGDGVIWTSTHNGLWRYDPSDGTADHFLHDPSDRLSLSDDNIYTFCMDAGGGLWAGTTNCGVDYSTPMQKCFQRHQTASGMPLEGAVIHSISSDGGQGAWVATESCGILYYDAVSGSLSAMKGLSGWTPTLLCDSGTLWASTHNGIFRYDIPTSGIRYYNWLDRDTHLKDNKISCIRRISSGDILCGTTLGLLSYDRDNDRFNSLPGLDGVFIRDISEDRQGRLYLATYADGLFCYDLKGRTVLSHWETDALEPYKIPSNKLNSLLLDSYGNLWVSSYSSGFFRIDHTDGSVGLYNTQTNAAVASDIVFSIVEDLRGRLWLASNKGLMRLDPTSGEIVTFTSRDGLLDDEFNYDSGEMLPDGTILFGSRNGMISFRPQDMEPGLSESPILFTDFSVGGQVMTPSTEGSPITANINETSRVVLSQQQNSFGLTLSMPALVSPTDGTVTYRLKGLDDEWKTLSWTGRRRTLNWSNLPAGRYTLEVSAPGCSHAPLEIRILRHPLLSIAAICIYLLIFALILLYLKNREKRRAEELGFRDKMAFFTNIIHEIKTPLTLIKTPLQNIMSHSGSGEDLSEDLSLINDNTLYMDRLVKEMLDFVRVEQNGYTLHTRCIDLGSKVGEAVTRFSRTSGDRNLSLSFEDGGIRVLVEADDSALTKIINNLLDNAVKYASSFIRVGVCVADGKGQVSISNDGPTIPRSRRAEIFKPFVQFNEETAPYSQSFGVGLSFARSLARLHGGDLLLAAGEETRFVLTLPLSREIPSAAVHEEQPQEGVPVADDRPMVLVVEDNEDLQGYLRRKLLSDGYRVAVCTSAEKALEAVEDSEVDLIISDIALEGMSGIELCRRINGDFNHSHIMVVMLSALTTPSVKVEALESGAALYIEKPFDLDYLLSSVKVLLGRRKALKNASMGEATPDFADFSLPGSDEVFLKRLDAVIIDNISDASLSNDQICEALSVSRSTLIRKVKGLLDTTPNDYIRLKRLSVAARMLQTNSVRISEVCYSVGFNTPSYFAKCFKAQYGVLPTEYAREYAKSNNQ